MLRFARNDKKTTAMTKNNCDNKKTTTMTKNNCDNKKTTTMTKNNCENKKTTAMTKKTSMTKTTAMINNKSYDKKEKSVKELSMSSGAKKVRAYLILLLALLMLLPACIRIQAPTQEVATAPVVVITQIVTEMIPPTPLPVTPTIAPSATALPPTLTPTWDPLSAPIYYPLADCVASRLHVGDNAMVSFVGGANGIRYGRDLAESTVDGYAQPGDILKIQGGPWCSRGWIVWFVKTADGLEGYTPEGDGNTYWLLPVK